MLMRSILLSGFLIWVILGCPPGKYQKYTDCLPCDSFCKTCYGPSHGECNSCNSGYFLDKTFCLRCAPGCKTCSMQSTHCTSCNPGSYLEEGMLGGGICKRCDSACNTCFGGSSSSCLSCPPKFYLSSSSCLPCHKFCATCEGRDNGDCLSCEPNFYLQPSDEPSSTCLPGCPPDTWVDSSNRICGKCDISCNGCTGAGNQACLSCMPIFYPHPHALNTCLTTCPTGYWNYRDNSTCLSCHNLCDSCTGPNQNQCLSCKSGFFMQPDDSSNAKCLQSCPKGYWKNKTHNICSLCDSSCTTCKGSGNSHCISCAEGFYAQPLSYGTCLDTCPFGFFKNSSGNNCLRCNQACDSCNESGTDCESCAFDYVKNKKKKTCERLCAHGTYPDDDGRCLPCSSPCVSCKTLLNSSCYSCPPNYFLAPGQISGECLLDCPLGSWKDLNKRQCISCDLGCLTCSGPGNDHCTSCGSEFIMQPYSASKCDIGCPEGYFIVHDSCQKCNAACLTCYGPSKLECHSYAEGFGHSQMAEEVAEKAVEAGKVREEL